jgi:hypothetical protein
VRSAYASVGIAVLRFAREEEENVLVDGVYIQRKDGNDFESCGYVACEFTRNNLQLHINTREDSKTYMVKTGQCGRDGEVTAIRGIGSVCQCLFCYLRAISPNQRLLQLVKL